MPSILRSLAGCAILIAALTGPALAHDWYPPGCCHGEKIVDGNKVMGDCRPIEPGDLVETNEKGCWKYVPTGNVFCGKQVHLSQDRHWHVCIGIGAVVDDYGTSDLGRSYCAFVQMGF